MTLFVEKGSENKILRTISKPVATITGDLRNFASNMIKTMELERGVGLAAPQVGRNIRLIVVKLNPGEHNEIVFPMVNPVIIETSEETEEGEEGCLSLPGIWGKVQRASRIVLRYRNLKNTEQTLELKHFNARIIQHEIDHLDGVLFVDRAFEIEEAQRSKKGHQVTHI